MGGLIGRLSDKAATHYRMLNTSKGYSAQGLRALLDRDIYRKVMIEEITNTKHLSILEASVEDFVINEASNCIKSVRLKD